MKLIECIEAGAARLQAAGVAFGQGTLNAFDEAAWLTLWRLGLPLDALDDHAEDALTPGQQAEVEALIGQRIATRQPAAYLTGEAWLQGVPFFIDQRSIVPRSFIAELIAEGSFDAWLGEHTQQVLDLCTGNGSLAVLAAMAWPDVQVTGADLSADALAVAARNVERHGLQGRVRVVQGDGLAAVAGQRFDLVLCNPPYVNAQSMAALPPEFRAEPELALAGGSDGMDFIRRLLAELPAHLNAGGVLVLEIGHERPFFEAAFPELEPVWLETSAGHDMVLLLTREQLA
ncbi:50S ribosomal protein L3 N(5)-glutamine methyltransferase [Inhella proteolytica]|uniref:50S ribosomal protein L3 N(5)-glutamine methyltransferase n=1 Tax=Inhella proteolytica TaxID=2795029 RepID=A0A931J106_9BURK|nr:50S ribosomal protein L3 N(5)-glutamine methyltransferase [Inhella proteolytica]MBH9575549.1 50S ribosomal protein L3 N(5)-glutamine methyltransferase [Inhella proteolytica]